MNVLYSAGNGPKINPGLLDPWCTSPWPPRHLSLTLRADLIFKKGTKKLTKQNVYNIYMLLWTTYFFSLGISLNNKLLYDFFCIFFLLYFWLRTTQRPRDNNKLFGQKKIAQKNLFAKIFFLTVNCLLGEGERGRGTKATISEGQGDGKRPFNKNCVRCHDTRHTDIGWCS